MKYRLLQARLPGDRVRHEEHAAFAGKLGVPIEHVLQHDLLSQPTELGTVTEGVDAVLVGGSGEFSIYDRPEWIHPFIDTLGALAEADFPTFASCFGFQGLVMALGGTVAKLENRAEVGTYTIERLPSAAGDPIFGALPDRFEAQLGHKDHAIDWPSEAVLLARSERCDHQAMRVGRRVYATQFHPELDHEENLLRFQRYEAHYIDAFGRERYQRMVEGFTRSDHASSLLSRFHRLLAE